MTDLDPKEIVIRRSVDGRWSSTGPNGIERTYSGNAAKILDEWFNKPAEGSKR
jgi:hypothetical protein